MPRRRNKRTPRLSVDLWGHVVLNLFTCPRKVFMMLCAVKGLQFNDEWWDKYWERHRRYNAARNYYPHNYLHRMEPTRPGVAKTLLRWDVLLALRVPLPPFDLPHQAVQGVREGRTRLEHCTTSTGWPWSPSCRNSDIM